MRRLCLILVLLLFASPALCWTIHKDFEGGTDGAAASGTYGFTEAGERLTFNTFAHGGTRSARAAWTPDGTDNWATHGIITYTSNVADGQEVWLRAYIYTPTGFDWDSANNVKQMRISPNDGFGAYGHNSHMSLAGGIQIQHEQFYSCDQNTDCDGAGPWPTGGITEPTGYWACHELYVKLSKGTSGIVRYWLDGTLRMNKTGVQTLYDVDGIYSSQSIFFGTWNMNAGGVPTTQYQYIDDIVITTDQPTTQDLSGYYMIGTGSYTPPADETAPEITSISVGTDGVTLAVNMSEVVTGGTLGNGGITLSGFSGGAVTAAYASGSGSSTLYYTLSREIQFDEGDGDGAYTKPGSAFVEDAAGNDLASISGITVTNYSTQGQTGDAPVMSNLTPTGMQACEEDPQPITFGLTTNVAATCRGSLTNTDYDTMGAGANFDTTGGTTHSSYGSSGIGCGSTFTLYVQCRDGSSNTTTTPGLISASIAAPSAETTPPTVTAFDVPATSATLTVTVTTFTATDNVGVTGYLMTETATVPSLSDPSWSVSVPSSYTFVGSGAKTLYAWAKDASGNISSSMSDTTTITLPVAAIRVGVSYNGVNMTGANQ